jgi:diaminohydroxyphosphoribosylaminopyrimidine deaminase / 5-amino-6-(5-phosphoribosylamino)uracil reductase
MQDQTSMVRGDTVEQGVSVPAEARAWRVIRALAGYARRTAMDPRHGSRSGGDADGLPVSLRFGDPEDGHWTWRPDQGWVAARPAADPVERDLLDLYLPLCAPVGDGCRMTAHLGQSLDGYIATANGDSCFVTGPDNIRHLHRMRALSDGVLVGTETAARDDPRLTTRLVPGANPVRVILDRQRRLGSHLRVFTDGAAATLLCCDRARVTAGHDRQGQARVIGLPIRDGRLDLMALAETLVGLGLRRIFVEGGGATVSAFLTAGLLDRLQIAVAPLLIGTGRPGLRIPAPERLADARRPAVRLFRMGADLLYDLDLRRGSTAAPPSPATRIL